MPALERPIERGAASATRQLLDIGAEFRERRMSLGRSQANVAAAGRVSRSRYAWIEAGKIPTLSVLELNRLGAVLGLDISVRLYPGGPALRDAGQSSRLASVLRACSRPLTWRIEVPLPISSDRWERRAWDAVIFGTGERTAIELEMRLRDVQAMRRRHELKRRDDPTEHFLLLIAGTRHNRRILAEFEDLFADLPRLRPSVVFAALQAGAHPPTGSLFV